MTASLERIVHLREVEKWSLARIGAELGVSKQTVSQRLIAAGYSPAAQAAGRGLPKDAKRSESRRQRGATRARMRELRVARLERECAALGVKPYTLAQYDSAHGPYEPGATGNGNHYGKGKLPPRHSDEGRQLVQHLRDLCAPWSVTTLARIAAKRA